MITVFKEFIEDIKEDYELFGFKYAVSRIWPIKQIRSKLRNIYYGIENLITWFPIIWNDRNWDHCFIRIMLKKKLELTYIGLTKYAQAKHSKRSIRSLKVAINLLKRMEEDNYHDNVFLHHDRKWGELQMKFLPIEAEKYYEMISHRPNVKCEEDLAQERKEYQLLSKDLKKYEQQDYDMLGQIIAKWLPHWWD